MSARRLTITVAAEEATCGPCQYAEYQGCGLTGTRWSVAGGGREPGCHAAERAHAEAIAQARREERARVVALARAAIRDRVAAYGPDRPDVKLGAEALAWFADALEREPC